MLSVDNMDLSNASLQSSGDPPGAVNSQISPADKMGFEKWAKDCSAEGILVGGLMDGSFDPMAKPSTIRKMHPEFGRYSTTTFRNHWNNLKRKLEREGKLPPAPNKTGDGVDGKCCFGGWLLYLICCTDIFFSFFFS